MYFIDIFHKLIVYGKLKKNEMIILCDTIEKYLKEDKNNMKDKIK